MSKRSANLKFVEKFKKLENGELEKELEELIKNAEEEKAAEEKTENPDEEGKAIEGKNKNAQDVEELKRIINNKKKIENVHEIMELLDEEAERIELEKQRRDSYKEFVENEKKLKEELAEYEEEKSKLNSAENKEKLEELDKKIKENKIKLEELNEKIEENKKSANPKYKEMSEDELNVRYNKVENKYRRCNLAFIYLLRGKSWDDVDLYLKDNLKNKSFTIKEGYEKRMKAKEKAAREENKDNHKTTDEIIEEGKAEKNDNKQVNKPSKDGKPTESIPNKNATQNKNSAPVLNVVERVNQEQEKNEQEQEKALIEKNKANTKRFSFNSIMDWFKNTRTAKFVKGIFNRGNTTQKVEAEPIKEEQVDVQKYKDQILEELINSKDDEFREQLKVFTDNGVDKIIETRIKAEKEAQERKNAPKSQPAKNNSGKGER